MSKLYEKIVKLNQYILDRKLPETIACLKESWYSRKSKRLMKSLFSKDFCFTFDVSDEGVSTKGNYGLLEKIKEVEQKHSFYAEKKRSFQNAN